MGEDMLYRLTEDGKRLVGEPFLKGEVQIEAEQAEDHVEPMPGDPAADLSRIDSAVSDVIRRFSKYDTAIDAALAEEFHRALKITRRTAGDPGLWHWLTVVKYPHLVRHRWEFRSEEAMSEKFLGAGTDLYSNAVHRLWWIAELTSRGDDYSTTEVVFSNQTMVNKVFDRWFARYQPATRAICEELAGEPSRVIEGTTRRFNHALTNVQLEGLSEEEAAQMIRKIVSDIR